MTNFGVTRDPGPGSTKPVSTTWDDERTHPETPDVATFQHHLARYEFALGRLRHGDRVLDSGCGVGYGTYQLWRKSGFALGVDYSMPALTYAREHYTGKDLCFAQMDCGRLALTDAAFDVIVSFEIFEHLDHSEEYLRECYRVLRPGGQLLLSTPNRAAWEIHMRSIGARYDFHVNMVDLGQLRRVLRAVFADVAVLGQRRRGNRLHGFLRALDIWNLRLRLVPPKRREQIQRAMNVPAGEKASNNDWIFDRSQLRQCNHFLAICRK